MTNLLDQAQPRVAPGPRGRPLVGDLMEYRRDQLGFMLGLWRTYGDAVRYRLGPVPAYLFVHPEHVEHILVTNSRNYLKGLGYSKLRVMVGDGLLTAEDPPWHSRRRLMHPPFTPRAVTRFGELVVAATDEMLARIAPVAASGQPFDLSAEATRLTATVIGRATLSADIGDQSAATSRALVDALEFISERTVTLLDLPLAVPTPANRRFRAALATLDTFVRDLIEERRSQPDRHDDLLALLLAARDEDGVGLSDTQLRDEVLTIFLAGHETTALALAWAWLLLARYPEAERRLIDEVDGVLGGRPPTAADLPRLEYTRAVFEEALRLYPPIWVFPRTARADDVVGGYRIQAGALVIISPYMTHRHLAFWAEPERFDPARFAEHSAVTRPRHAYIPFGAGPRICLGNHLALMEAQLVLARVAQRYRFRAADVTDPPPSMRGTLRPRDPIRVIAEPRCPS